MEDENENEINKINKEKLRERPAVARQKCERRSHKQGHEYEPAPHKRLSPQPHTDHVPGCATAVSTHCLPQTPCVWLRIVPGLALSRSMVRICNLWRTFSSETCMLRTAIPIPHSLMMPSPSQKQRHTHTHEHTRKWCEARVWLDNGSVGHWKGAASFL